MRRAECGPYPDGPIGAGEEGVRADLVLLQARVGPIVPPSVRRIHFQDAATVRVAVLLPDPAEGIWVVVTPEVVFGLTPVLLLVTRKVTVQLPDAGRLIPVKLKAVCPAVNVDGVVPLHVPPTAPATALMFVRVSVKAPPLRADVLPLDKVRVTMEVPPAAMLVGLNAFAMLIAAHTVKVAVLLPAPAVGICVVVMPEVVLCCAPSVVLVTAKVTVQLPDAGMLIPVKLNAVCPAVKVDGLVPVQVPPTAPPDAFMFVSVSEKAPPVKAVALPLVKVRVTVEVLPD